MASTNMFGQHKLLDQIFALGIMVANQFLSQSSTRQRIKQPASVPFIWEVRPGLPKTEWKHFAPVGPTALPPVKLTALDSLIQWEEMPGKPLHCFPHEMPDAGPLVQLPPPMLRDSQSPRPTVDSHNIWYNADDDDGCDGDDEKDEIIDSYLDAWGFEDVALISSAPSLLANRLIPTLAISNAVPVIENGLINGNNLQLQATFSPIYESDSSTSSYATGNTCLDDTPILERLFPLLLRKSSFQEKVGCEKGTHTTPQTLPSRVPDMNYELDQKLVVKKPLTLGEQILISRKRSYHRKANLMRDQNHSMEFMKKSVLGCCMAGSVNKIKRLQGKWKKHLQLKPS
ncbi:hypothetical protein ACET3Z_014865 [Daucus carota]